MRNKSRDQRLESSKVTGLYVFDVTYQGNETRFEKSDLKWTIPEVKAYFWWNLCSAFLT